MAANSDPVVQRLLRDGGKSRINHVWSGIQAAHTVLVAFNARYSENTLEIGNGAVPCYVFRPGQANLPAKATYCIEDWTREEEYVLERIRQIAGHFIVTKCGDNILLQLPGNPWVRDQKQDKQQCAAVYSAVCVREANLQKDNQPPADGDKYDTKEELPPGSEKSKKAQCEERPASGSSSGSGSESGAPAAEPGPNDSVRPSPGPDAKPEDAVGADNPPDND